MNLEQEVFQLSVRTSLNLIYTMSRTIATVMPMEGEIAADVIRTSSEMILREVVALHDKLSEAYAVKENNC